MYDLKSKLFYVAWVAVVVTLLLVSYVFKDSRDTIMAVVEPQRMAISFLKPVEVKEIFVIPGQDVEPGDKLLRVVRPDLVLDLVKKENEVKSLQTEEKWAKEDISKKLQVLEIETTTKRTKLNADIGRLKAVMQGNEKLAREFGELANYKDTLKRYGPDYFQVEITALEREKQLLDDYYRAEIRRLNSSLDEKLELFAIRAGQLEEEISKLNQEEINLIQYAQTKGTIGNVYAEINELVPPYNTVISIYKSNPTIIKAYMNELNKYPLHVGDEVQVESMNRFYKIEGEIIEVGSRIVEFPQRLHIQGNLKVWGQEIFVRIPAENNFLNGERVFVVLE